MKKLLGILVLGLLLVPTQVKAGPIGSGELKLKPQAVQAWINYVKQKNKPRIFLVPIDGSSAYWWYCPKSVTCVPGGSTQELRKCENFFKGKQCKIFARGRTIKWKNGINKGNKESRFNSKMSESEIKAKLTELGFLGGETKKIKIKKKKYEASITNSFSKEVYKGTSNNSLDEAKRYALDKCKIYEEKPELCGKVEKKKEPKKKMNKDIVKQLKDLEKMYKSGSLTKEEYTKAKKKLLN